MPLLHVPQPKRGRDSLGAERMVAARFWAHRIRRLSQTAGGKHTEGRSNKCGSYQYDASKSLERSLYKSVDP